MGVGLMSARGSECRGAGVAEFRVAGGAGLRGTKSVCGARQGCRAHECMGAGGRAQGYKGHRAQRCRT